MSAEVVLSILAEVLGVAQEDFGKRRRNSPLRAVAARYLVRSAGLRQREVSKLLGMSTGGAVSAQLARLPELIRTEARLGRRVGAIERLLDEKRAEAASGASRNGKS